MSFTRNRFERALAELPKKRYRKLAHVTKYMKIFEIFPLISKSLIKYEKPSETLFESF
jgi:hypothetical protein